MADQGSPTSATTRQNTPSLEVIREFNDRGTLWLLEDPVHLQSLLRILEPELAANLDIERAERVNRSFIPADLLKEESDLIFRIPFRAASDQIGVTEVLIYVLLEHQSKPDPLMGLRLFLYLGELWDTQLREWKDAGRATPLRLLPVVPVVFYTGTENWNTPISLSGLMDLPPALQRFVPTWDTLFLNLNRTSPQTLTQFATAVGYALRVLQAEREPLAELGRVLTEAMAGLEGLTAEQSGQWLRVAWYLVLFAYHRRERLEYDELVQLIRGQAKGSKFRERTEVESMAETMAQWMENKAEQARKEAEIKGREAGIKAGLEAGLEAGRVEGREKGRAEQTRALLLRLGGKRFGEPDAQSRAALEAITSLAPLERLMDRLLEVESWQELLA